MYNPTIDSRRRVFVSKDDLFDANDDPLCPARSRQSIRSVRAGILSPAFLVLIQKPWYGPNAWWSLPGGRPEKYDRDSVATARREAQQETGISGFSAYPAFKNWGPILLASGKFEDLVQFFVNDEQIKTIKPVGDENGRPINVRLFPREEVLDLKDLEPNHRQPVEMFFAELSKRRL